METVRNILSRHVEEKRWGCEEWIVNNDLYCGKRLCFSVPGGSTSLHFHVQKHETMYVESGSFEIIAVDTGTGVAYKNTLNVGDSIVIPPFTPHRIIAVCVPSVLLEFSTHHENNDSYRVEP